MANNVHNCGNNDCGQKNDGIIQNGGFALVLVLFILIILVGAAWVR